MYRNSSASTSSTVWRAAMLFPFFAILMSITIEIFVIDTSNFRHVHLCLAYSHKYLRQYLQCTSKGQPHLFSFYHIYINNLWNICNRYFKFKIWVYLVCICTEIIEAIPLKDNNVYSVFATFILIMCEGFMIETSNLTHTYIYLLFTFPKILQLIPKILYKGQPYLLSLPHLCQ